VSGPRKRGLASSLREHRGIWITELGSGSLAVKDLFDTAGVRTTYGSPIFADHVPDTTAEAVARLEAADYSMAGKANLHEFAWGITSENLTFGTVPNPIAPGRIAGGSSGGCAAALAAGLVDYAIGTDSGGSIRIPAACCGIAGFKPTHGLVPLDGCFPLAPSFDHAGPMARDVEGCERMLEALVPGFAAIEAELADVRIGVGWTERADPLVRARVEAVAAGFEPVEVPWPDGVYPAFSREIVESHAELYPANRDRYDPGIAAKMDKARLLSDAQVTAAAAARERYRERIAALDLDLLVTPTVPMVAPPAGLGDLALRDRMIELTFPWNVTGAPALALPCGPAEDGLPASVQLVGPPGEDALVLAAGRALSARVRAADRASTSRAAQ
jgi:aspartyl-tRNA(Asn)/glutamyl-tRNA(Gln) amidotransferase subunit A